MATTGTERTGSALTLAELGARLVKEQADWWEKRLQALREEQSADEKMTLSLLLLLFEMKGALQAQPEGGAAVAEDLIRRGLQIIEDNGYHMEDFTGRELDDDLRERLVFAGYRYHDREVDTVSETLVPQISRGERILRQSTVIGASADADMQA